MYDRDDKNSKRSRGSSPKEDVIPRNRHTERTLLWLLVPISFFLASLQRYMWDLSSFFQKNDDAANVKIRSGVRPEATDAVHQPSHSTNGSSEQNIMIEVNSSGETGASLLPGLPEGRAHRFPSIEERVRVYMAYWYLPPCDNTSMFFYRYNGTAVTLVKGSQSDTKVNMKLTVNSNQTMETPFFAKQSDYDNCEERFQMHKIRRILSECLDIKRSIPRPLLWHSSAPNQPPIILRMGDNPRAQRVPSFHYCHPALTRDELSDLTTNRACSASLDGSLPPITLNLNTPRFLGPLHSVAKNDHLWQEKKDKAVFRGALTGVRNQVNIKDPVTVCQGAPRCKLVLRHANSSLVDANLTAIKNPNLRVVDGINLIGRGLSIMEQLEYKALIFLDGNDVSSGVKWGLLSRSVVLMKKPTFSSWAMEELLQPYVHYLPLNEDLSNVEEQVLWIKDHDKEAQEIAHRSSLWMQDLVFHPNSSADDKAINKAILERYAMHFRPLA